MEFKLTINLDNAAFDPPHPGLEVARILREVAERERQHSRRVAGDQMSKLSDTARDALRLCYATKGKHRGQLLARCPRSHTLAAAAWQGAMLSCNPYRASIGAMLFMSSEQRAIRDEVLAHFDAMPREYRIMAERNREALEALGVW